MFQTEITCLECDSDVRVLNQQEPKRGTFNVFAKGKVVPMLAAEHKVIFECVNVECQMQWLYDRKLTMSFRPKVEQREQTAKRKAS